MSTTRADFEKWVLTIQAEAWEAGYQAGAYWGDPNPPTPRDEKPPFDNPYTKEEQ